MTGSYSVVKVLKIGSIFGFTLHRRGHIPLAVAGSPNFPPKKKFLDETLFVIITVIS